MTTVSITRPLSFAGVPLRSWAFGIRIWIGVVAALAVSFWLQLEAAYSSAVTVAILATPTCGQALDKALYRLLATVIGVTAAIVMTAIFSQARDLLLLAPPRWLGIC